jgi:hypothetical protein
MDPVAASNLHFFFPPAFLPPNKIKQLSSLPQRNLSWYKKAGFSPPPFSPPGPAQHACVAAEQGKLAGQGLEYAMYTHIYQCV